MHRHKTGEELDSNAYRLTLGTVERRAREYLKIAVSPSVPEFLRFLKESRQTRETLAHKETIE